MLGSLAGLLILAGAVYYFAGHRVGPEVATDSSSERPAVPDNPRVSDNAQKPASPTTTSQAPPSVQPQSPQPSEPQQSASAPPPPPATAPVDTPAAPPATTASPPVTPATPPATTAMLPAEPTTPPATIAQDSATKSRAAGNERSPDAATAAPSADPGAATQANPTAQPSMRDQPAALPDPPAAAPEKENVLVVMRGPANIRSAPGKKGRVIGTAPRDATVKELDRSGNWVQVETEAGTGWINAALLGARSPERR